MSAVRPGAIIVLAAGGGTRMKSATPKMLHRIGGRTLLGHVVAAAREADPRHLVAVVRHERDLVVEHLREIDPDVLVADQDEIYGTGRAVECGLAALPPDLTGTVVVAMSDTPLLSARTLAGLAAARESTGSAATVITAELDDPTGYGRILRSADGDVAAIVEQKDATPEQLASREVNSGIWAFDAALLRSALTRVGTDNAAGEKYLTDVPEILRAEGHRVTAHQIDDVWETEGVNNRVQLARLGSELNRRVLERWMLAGVEVVDPAHTWVDVTVTLAPDVSLRPGVQLHGSTVVESGAVIGPDTTLTDVRVGPDARVVRTHGSEAVLGAGASVGPFAYLRPGTRLGDTGKIGTFVETKNASIGAGSKVPHLTYVGDAEIGESSNIGAGTIFANYDGVNKHRTTVGNHVKTGANNTFVAPVSFGDGSSSGGGTVVRRRVPPGALAVSAAPQRNVDDWVQRKRPGTPAAEAAQAAREREDERP